MTWNEFEELLDELVAEVRERLVRKGYEYATKEDRFNNFHKGAQLLGISPLAYCKALMTKHIVSIMELPESANPELVDEKIGDAIAYLFLLWAMHKEQLRR